MNRTDRALKAKETLDIFGKGYYSKNNETINCHSCFTTDFISENELCKIALSPGNFVPQYEVVNESVVDTVIRYPNCGVLNFASAKNPGGGFLNGAVAQEECLTISSDLYMSLLTASQFYEINRRSGTALYTNNMIYSSNISFIRNGRLELLNKPIMANVLTSPAVNANAFYRNENGDALVVYSVMEQRIKHILNLFVTKGDRTIILGAFGCGVFGNDASDIAGIFKKLLIDEHLESHFEKIIFAIYDSGGKQYSLFKKTFNNIIVK